MPLRATASLIMAFLIITPVAAVAADEGGLDKAAVLREDGYSAKVFEFSDRIFLLKAADFYRKLDLYFAHDPAYSKDLPALSEALEVNAGMTREGIGQLIERYGLRGKRLLSIGPGPGHEEYWFYKAAASLVFVDNIADWPEGMNALRAIKLASDRSDVLEYHAVGLEDFVGYSPTGSFDVVYMSSFTPDELRKEKIQADFIATRSEEQRQAYVTWPKDQKPYSDLVMKATTLVKEGGIFIFQHYRAGIDVTYNPHFIDLMKAQFEENGDQLLEYYHFSKAPGVALVVGFRGSVDRARDYLARLPPGHLTTFHGRYRDDDVKKDITLAYRLK